MFRRRRFLFFTCMVSSVFFFTTFYLIFVLPNDGDEVKSVRTLEEKIYWELKNLPEFYKDRAGDRDEFDKFIGTIRSGKSVGNLSELWKVANSWVKQSRVVEFDNPSLGDVMYALRNSKVVKADLDTRGTQLKLLLTLQGGQQAVFKPQWYDKHHVIHGPVYAGKDRHSSEILAFYLSAILNKPLTPVSVERELSLKREIKPVATARLSETMFEDGNRTCVYGKCFFCRKNDPICGDEKDSTLAGVVILNLGTNLRNHRSPWQRTYKKGRVATWQENEAYCDSIKEKLPHKRLYDLIDISIFDFLIQNGDRHHYETFGDSVIWLDNGKGLGNPFVHHLDILAPMYQCCMLRRETWKTLLGLTGGALGERLRSIEEVIRIVSEDHLKAIEFRLSLVFATIEYCKHKRIPKEM